MAPPSPKQRTAPPAVKFVVYLSAAVGALVLVWTRIPTAAWYRDRRPTRFGKLTNRTMARFAALGLPAFSMVALEVPGRKTGRTTSTVLVLTRYDGDDYLISMLGERVDWVRNVRANHGTAALRHGRLRRVHLDEVPVDERAPILHAYVQIAPGGRRHFPIGLEGSIADFVGLAPDYPVFRIAPA